MATRSQYDELHDRYHKILSTKAGTRYEILAALVFKALEEQNTVVHDLKLVGESDVAHQIDVSIESKGAKRRVLIECKDFDISGEKIGLDIIRNFRSVLEDTRADEGIIITCNGFTTEAQKYAKAKSIKLAILRKFEDSDMKGRIKTIIVNLIVHPPKTPTATVSFSDTNKTLFAQECARIGISGGVSVADPVYFVRGTDRIQFNEFLTSQMRAAMAAATGTETQEISIPTDGWTLQVDGGTQIQFDAIKVNFQMDSQTHQIVVTSQRIAELILSGFGKDDIVIFGDQLERRVIDPETGMIL